METSDSECFESADEQFFSDSEDEITQKIVEKKVSKVTEDLNNLKILQNKKETDAGNITKVVKENIYQDANTNIVESSRDILQNIPNEGSTVNLVKHNEITNISIKDEKPEAKQTVLKRKLSTEKLDVSNDEIKNEIVKPKNIDAFEGDGWDVEDEETGLWKDDEIHWSVGEESKDLKTNIQSFNVQTTYSKAKNDIKTDISEVSNENMWENEEWEDFENDVPENPKKLSDKNEADSSWSGWGNWGVSSILNTATQGVSTITNQVSQGLSAVLETSIGIPNPEQLAKIHLDEEKQLRTEKPENLCPQKVSDENSSGFGFGNLVSGVTNITKFVESTSTKVIAGGLDTLETIGKKTMEVLQEGDPGLKKKRAFLKLDQEKPILSQILREAKEKAERENASKDRPIEIVRKLNYETLFDDHHGLVHLEALEMLSKQCEIKLKTLIDTGSDNDIIELQETMDQVKELCELPDEDEEEQLSTQQFKEKLQAAMEDIKVNITYEKLLSTWEETEQWLNNLKLNICDEEELHQQAIETLAQLTALAVEQYHKAGELLLVKEHRSTADEADSLVQLTTTLTSLIGVVAAKFSDKLNSKLAQGGSNQESINGLITNVFFEAANSSSYIQDAFQLLIPVIQIGAV